MHRMRIYQKLMSGANRYWSHDHGRMEAGNPWLIITPSGTTRFTWDCVTTFLVLFIGATLPYRIAFVPAAPYWLIVVEFLIDIWFLVDMMVTSRTAYVDDGVLVTSWRAILRNYVYSIW